MQNNVQTKSVEDKEVKRFGRIWRSISSLNLFKPKPCEWEKRAEGVYVTEIFKEDKVMATHELMVESCPGIKTEPLGNVVKLLDGNYLDLNHLREFSVECDASLIIAKHYPFDGYFPRFEVLFTKGKFEYGEYYDPEDIEDVESYGSIDKFKADITKFFDFTDYKQFSKFLTNSNLPNEVREAINDIL